MKDVLIAALMLFGALVAVATHMDVLNELFMWGAFSVLSVLLVVWLGWEVFKFVKGNPIRSAKPRFERHKDDLKRDLVLMEGQAHSDVWMDIEFIQKHVTRRMKDKYLEKLLFALHNEGYLEARTFQWEKGPHFRIKRAGRRH